jgi:hypothetical protein
MHEMSDLPITDDEPLPPDVAPDPGPVNPELPVHDEPGED